MNIYLVNDNFHTAFLSLGIEYKIEYLITVLRVCPLAERFIEAQIE